MKEWPATLASPNQAIAFDGPRFLAVPNSRLRRAIGSQSVIAINKTTGEQVWKVEGSKHPLSFGTPALVVLSKVRFQQAE